MKIPPSSIQLVTGARTRRSQPPTPPPDAVSTTRRPILRFRLEIVRIIGPTVERHGIRCPLGPYSRISKRHYYPRARRSPSSPASSSARRGRRRPRGRSPATSTPPAARRAWRRTARPGRCTARTTARCTRSGAPRTTPPGTSASLSAGGYANAAAQDSFCAGTTCVITVIYDQSGRGQPPHPGASRRVPGPAAGGYDNLANATAAPITVGGHKAYGVFVAPGTGYRNNTTNGIATGRPAGGHVRHLRRHALQRRLLLRLRQRRDQQPRQRQRHAWRPSTSATSRSGATAPATAPGSWPTWRTACSPASTSSYNANDPTISYRFLTAIVKGEPNHWAIRGGNAQSGGLSTFYNGVRPNVSGYNPMKKEGAIILGIGGDNSNGAAGTFYEGVMTSGYPVGRHRERRPGQHRRRRLRHRSGGGAGLPHARARRSRCGPRRPAAPDRYIRHQNDNAVTSVDHLVAAPPRTRPTPPGSCGPGLANSSCVSFESSNYPGDFLRHYNFQLRRQTNDGSSLFAADATFCPQTGRNGQGSSFAVVQLPDEVPAPLQQHRLHRQQRRLERL